MSKGTKERLQTMIEGAPAAVASALDLSGWRLACDDGDWFICAACAARIMARGCRLPGKASPVWCDDGEPAPSCVVCAPAPVASAMTPASWSVRRETCDLPNGSLLARWIVSAGDWDFATLESLNGEFDDVQAAHSQAIAAVPALVEAVRKAAQYTKHPVNSSDMRYAVQELCVAALKSAGVQA